jgi:hypothetical protein
VVENIQPSKDTFVFCKRGILVGAAVLGAETKMIEVECGSCGGTGLYSGLCEGKGRAVICIRCSGTGCQKLETAYGNYTPFTGRKRRSDIQRVFRGGGTMIFMGAGPKGAGISYEQFWNGVMP